LKEQRTFTEVDNCFLKTVSTLQVSNASNGKIQQEGKKKRKKRRKKRIRKKKELRQKKIKNVGKAFNVITHFVRKQ